MCILKSFIKLTLLLFLFILMWSCQQENVYTEDKLEKGEKPEETRFTKIVLIDNLDEPMQFQVLKDSRVLIAERKGKIKLFDPSINQLKVIADIPVSIGYYSETGEELESTGEDGMQGAVLDPNFDQNHWIYLYYSPKGGDPRSILARYEWRGSELNIDSKKILLEVPNQRESCCHLGGGMLFDSMGNLFLSTGDNTANDPRGYSPIDERSGRNRYDAQRSSSNTNDLRGKILRIHPESNGTYSIPEGNLFPKDLPKTRPEIYTMGNRNPWRLSIDSKTGWLYWGEVGPGGTTDSVGMGPRSYDEFNQARKAGNYGWPYFSADNKKYWKYDYATNKSGEKYDPFRPVNDSPNNSGLIDLPPAQPAFIWYPQSKSVEFPLLGSGSNSAVGGPIYHRSDFENPKRPFPKYYEGKWLITDWTRGWIMAVSFDENGVYKSMEQFLPEINLNGPIDMEFGPDGDLYIMEYGRGPYQFNPEAQLVRIEYNDGNRKPIVAVSADKGVGAVPLNVKLSSVGTKDYDNDQLTYEWKIISKGKRPRIFTAANPLLTFSEPGIYQAILTVKDSEGAKDSSAIEIIAGNDPPKVKIDFNGANKSFFFLDNTINYSVDVSDKEDGSLADQKISPSQVAVSIDYLTVDSDFPDIKQSLGKVDALISIQTVIASQLISQSDCQSCHAVNAKLAGPSYTEIAKKYKEDENARNYLKKKIISGGTGVWGDMAMPPHPTLTENAVNTIVKYILNLHGDEQMTQKSRPVNGKYETKIPKDDSNTVISVFGPSYTDKFIFRASYTDRGAELSPEQSSVDIVILRNPIIPVIQAHKFESLEWNHAINPNRSSVSPKKSGAYLAFYQIDLTEISQIEFAASVIPGASSTSEWVIEIRIDSPTGKLIGKTSDIMLTKNLSKKNLPQVKADIVSTGGLHDLYFIFINKKEGSANSQMQIREIKFIGK